MAFCVAEPMILCHQGRPRRDRDRLGAAALTTFGERAFECSTVCRRSMCGEHELDRQLEERPETIGDLLARTALALPLVWVEREAVTEVGERVARDDRVPTLDPEHQVVVRPAGERLDPDGKPVSRQVQVCLSA